MKTLIVMKSGETALIEEDIHKIYNALKEGGAISINDSAYLGLSYLSCLFDGTTLYKRDDKGDFICLA